MKNAVIASGVVITVLCGGASESLAGLKPSHSVGAFTSNDDGYRHAIIATTDDCIREVYWNQSHTFFSSGVLTCFSGVVAVDGFYSGYDNYRHAIVGLSNGQVWEVYYQPAYGVAQALLYTLSPGSIIAVSGWSGGSTKYHAAVALTSGCVYDYEYGPGVGSPAFYSAGCFGSVNNIDGVSGDVLAISPGGSGGYVYTRSWADSSHASSGATSTLYRNTGTGSLNNQTGVGINYCSGYYNMWTMNTSWQADNLFASSASSGYYWDALEYSFGAQPVAISADGGYVNSSNNGVIGLSNGQLYDMVQVCSPTNAGASLYWEGGY